MESQSQPLPLHIRAENTTRLIAMGLTEELLAEAVRYGYTEAERCSGNDVRMAGGTNSWGKPLRYLRENLLPKGWSKGGPPNLESVISPDRSFQIASAGANSFTGQPDRMPSTQNLKGPLTALAISGNKQMALDIAGSSPEPAPEMQTWYLLRYLDEAKDEIRCELSIPTHIAIRKGAKRGRIDEFGSRLILTPIKLGSDTDLEGERDEEFSEDLDIPVARRASS
jgi:hypothetical protein